MKKWEKEILEKQINDEKAVIKNIETVYKEALKVINEKIEVLKAREQTQSVIYQLRYQQALQAQIEEVFAKLSNTMYKTVDEYLLNCYEESFYSTMYALQQQGIPIIIPFDQGAVAQMAAQSEYSGIKLSEKMYSNAVIAAVSVRREISRGLAMNSSYADIARAVAKAGEPNVNQAYRIVRTEGHRIQQETGFKTANKAKKEGAEIVKQWDSTLDSRTRPAHSALDGQIRELNEPFEINGKTAQYPGGFGVAAEDIHCRCVALQRARWALNETELETLKQRAEYFGLDKTKNFDDFKEKYVKAEGVKN